MFPRVPERTRLFRLLKTHQDRTKVFLAAPTVLGVIDTYGIELIHPIREGRSPQQIDRKGLSNGDVSEVLVCYSLGVYETQSNPQANQVIA